VTLPEDFFTWQSGISGKTPVGLAVIW